MTDKNHGFEVIQGGKKNGGKDDERRTARNFVVIDGGKSGVEKGIQRETVENSKIEEKKVFEREEILALIKTIAEGEGFREDDIEVEKEFYDAGGNLVSLRARVKSGKAKGRGFGNIVYKYMVKGVHGEDEFSNNTLITRMYAGISKPNEFIAGGIVARYKDGQWVFSPDAISPNATDIHPDE